MLHSIVLRSVRCRAGRSRPPPLQHVEPFVEPPPQLVDREQRDARGGELDRERQPVEPAADGGDVGRVLVGELEVGPQRDRALDEQLDRLRCERVLQRDCAAPAGSVSGGTGNSRSPRTRNAARLVTSAVTPGQCASSSAKPVAASTTCSKLSSTSSNCRSRRPRLSTSSGGSSPEPAIATVRTMAA